MRRPRRQAPASASMARSKAWLAASLRYFSRALTALSTTLTMMSPGLSSSSTARCTKGTPSLTVPASFNLKSARPSYPTLRQKRTTVGLLTCARSASSLTGGLAKLRASATTSFATRCSAGGNAGIDARTRSIMLIWSPPSCGLLFFGPRVAVARHQRAGRGRPPAAGGIGAWAAGVARPGIQHGLDPFPRLPLLVAAHEEIEPAGDRLGPQALLGAHALAREGLVEIEVQRHRCQQLAMAGADHAALGREQPQLESIFRLQLDQQLVR